MHDIEEAILNIFKNYPSKELNAEFLSKELYPKEYKIIVELASTEDKAKIQDAKRRKFQLHRKILYYLNKLIENNIIKVSRTAEKGEKYFILHAGEGDTIIGRGYKKIVISRPSIVTTSIESYESKGVMKKYEEESWINRFNSILLECKNKNAEQIYKTLSECITTVNDVIALNEFENIINTSDGEELKKFIQNISKDSDINSKTISLIINISEAGNNLKQFIEYYSNINPRMVNIIFNIGNKDVQKHSKILSHIVEKFSEQKIKINFKNTDISSTPYFKGRAGIYDFDEQEWNIYSKKYKGSIIGIVCSQSQIALNINKFFENYTTDTEFREAVLNAAKALLLADTIQRRKSNEYFKNINSLNNPNIAEFYHFSRNYIRFWNYDWNKDIKENDNLIELIKSSKESVDKFCHTEETIFKSCGIPIRFKIAFSSAFRNYDKKFMGERDYKKVTVKKVEDYYNGETKEFLHAREKMFEIMDGGDRLRIFRANDFKTPDIIHELGILLNTYKLPFFTYDFSGLKGIIKLTNFM